MTSDWMMTPRSELDQMRRSLDTVCVFLFGHTIDGDRGMKMDVTPDSWCGRMQRIPQTVNKVMAIWFVGMTFVIALLTWIMRK